MNLYISKETERLRQLYRIADALGCESEEIGEKILDLVIALDDMIEAYILSSEIIGRVHRSLGISPSEANYEHINKLRHKSYQRSGGRARIAEIIGKLDGTQEKEEES